MPAPPGVRRRAHAVSNRWPSRQDCTAVHAETGRIWAWRTRKRGCQGRRRRARRWMGGGTPPSGSLPQCTRDPPAHLLPLCGEQERMPCERLLGLRRRFFSPAEEQRASEDSRQRTECAKGRSQRSSTRVVRIQRLVQGGCFCMACAQDRRGFSWAGTFSVVEWCSESRLSTRAGDEEHLVVRERRRRDAEREGFSHRKSLCNRALHKVCLATVSVTASDRISA